VNTLALEGLGVKIRFSASGFEADLIALTLPEVGREAIDTTHLGTESAKTKKPGETRDLGTVQAVFDYDPAAVSLVGRPPEQVVVTYPDDLGREFDPIILWASATEQGGERMFPDGRMVTSVTLSLSVADPPPLPPSLGVQVVAWPYYSYAGVDVHRITPGANGTGTIVAPVPSSQPSALESLVYADGFWYCLRLDGKIYRSSTINGTWSLVFSDIAPLVALASNGAGVLVVASTFGHVVRSADNGATWTRRPNILNYVGRDSVTYGAGRFVIQGEASPNAGRWAYSPNGLTWTVVVSPNQGSGSTISGVYFRNNLFIGLAVPATQIYTSTDGITWQDRGSYGSANAAQAAYCAAVSAWVVMTLDGHLASTDGATWSYYAKPHASQWDGVWELSDGTLVAADLDGNLWQSSDAATWAQVGTATPADNPWRFAVGPVD
jgi:hypothetical protein